jgi:hypothetical protein
MSITVLGADGGPFDQNSIISVGDRFIKAIYRFVLSGNYVTGGDNLDFTNAGGTPAAPNAVPVAQSRGLISIDIRPISKLTTSFAAAAGQYEIIVPGGVLPVALPVANSFKLKLMLDIAFEYAAEAYGADALGDILQAEVHWLR